MSRSLRILVASPAAEPGHGGAEWAIWQYVLGLRRLGHEARLANSVDGVYDVVLNTSGILPPESIAAIPLRVYLDLDPAFNQLWHLEGIDRHFDGHTHFVTVGQAIGHATCPVPTLGFQWIGTLPPVVLEEWPLANGVETNALTTVANFRSYGSITRDGVIYGQKVHSLRTVITLPRRVGERFVVAMRLHADEQVDISALQDNGWELIDPCDVAATPRAYRRFVQGSLAEIGIAKSGYVVSHCGWFSDRSACYLASGRPVIAQDTGFPQFLPAGDGLMPFGTQDEAALAIERLRSNYSRHSRAARAIAEEFLDSDVVLAKLLNQVVT